MLRLLAKHPDGLDGFEKPTVSHNTQAFYSNQNVPVINSQSTHHTHHTEKQSSQSLAAVSATTQLAAGDNA